MDRLVLKEFLPYYNQDLHAKTAIDSVHSLMNSSTQPFQSLFDFKQHSFSKYPENIVMQNAINCYVTKLHNNKNSFSKRKEEVLKKIDSTSEDASNVFSKKIKHGRDVFVHSLNNVIYEGVKDSEKKKVTLHVLEHVPFSLGKHLKQKCKNTVLYSDLLIHQAIENSDICFVGAHSICHNGVICKPGSVSVLDISKEKGIPCYIVAHSFHYDRRGKTLQALSHEHDTEQGHDINTVLEFVPREKVRNIICDFGVFPYDYIHEEILAHNKWMFLL